MIPSDDDGIKIKKMRPFIYIFDLQTPFKDFPFEWRALSWEGERKTDRWWCDGAEEGYPSRFMFVLPFFLDGIRRKIDKIPFHSSVGLIMTEFSDFSIC